MDRLLSLLLTASTLLLYSGTPLADINTCVQTEIDSTTNGCYTITAPLQTTNVSASSIPLSEIDWTIAEAVEKVITGGGLDGILRILRDDAANLYLSITVNDGTPHGNDEVSIFMDPLHLHNNTPTQLNEILISRVPTTEAGDALTLVVDGGEGCGAWDEGEIEVTEDTDYWTIKLRIPASQIRRYCSDTGSVAPGLTHLPSIMGFGIEVRDTLNPSPAIWPDSESTIDPPFMGFDPDDLNTWAHLKTRYPIDYMIVLDRSGSMSQQSKWDNAKAAANLMANTISILGNPDYFEDRLGLTTFTAPCSGDLPPLPPDTDIPLAPIAGFLGDYTVTLTGPGNCTPIGEGLKRAFLDLSSDQDINTAQKRRGVLLLSDGKHNRPSTTFSPSETGYQPCAELPEACNDDTACSSPSNIQVSTIAFGEEGEGDAFVDPDLLCKIKNIYSQGFEEHFTLSDNLETLRETFVHAMDDYYRYNVSRIDITDFPAFDITSDNHQLIVLLIWNDPAEAQDAKLQRDGIDLDPDLVQVTCATNTDIGFSRCVLANPEGSTQWQAVPEDSGGTFLPLPNMRIVLADPKVLSHFAIDRVAHGTGVNLTLTAELKQGGRRLTDDSENGPIKVAVEIEGPEEGFGNFVSTHSPRDCRDIVPALPPVDPRVLSAFDRKAATIGAVSNTLPSAGSGDPPALHFTLMQKVLNACGKNGLESSTGSRELRDDGSNGDMNAGDGIYTYRFVPEVEGTYTFRFNVEGKSLDGEEFTRTKRFSEYVRVEVAPSNTLADSRVVQRDKNLVTHQYYVTPRDKFGGYLGPGHAQQVAFTTTSGKWLDPVMDNIDDAPGIYSRLLRYDVTQGEPRVVATVQGKALPAITGKAFELFPFVGRTMFDNSLALDDGALLGLQFNYRLNEKWFTGLELAQTNTETTAGDSGKMTQAFANFRYEPRAWLPGELSPHIGGGLGYVWFRNFTNEDEAFAIQGSGGATYNFSESFGVRAEARLLYIDDVWNKGATTNTQIDVGLVFRFD